RGGPPLDRQVRQRRLYRALRARAHQNGWGQAQVGRLRDGRGRDRTARLSAPRLRGGEGPCLHQRPPPANPREKTRARRPAHPDVRDRDEVPRRLPRPNGRGGRRENAVLQARIKMASDDVRSDRRYTKDHEWAKLEGSNVLVGITAFAVDQLGDITLVNLDVKPGE